MVNSLQGLPCLDRSMTTNNQTNRDRLTVPQHSPVEVSWPASSRKLPEPGLRRPSATTGHPALRAPETRGRGVSHVTITWTLSLQFIKIREVYEVAKIYCTVYQTIPSQSWSVWGGRKKATYMYTYNFMPLDPSNNLCHYCLPSWIFFLKKWNLVRNLPTEVYHLFWLTAKPQ